jgi:hypothetical protein
MHPSILGIALGTQLVLQASDRLPNFNMERTCKVLKEQGANSDQSYKECLSSEKLAQQQLGPMWSSYSAAIRARCTSDTISLGMNSFLDLLTCLQMTDSVGPNASSSKPLTGPKPSK